MEKRQENPALAILNTVGAVLRGGHFVYASGKHGHTYIDKDKIFANPQAALYICELLATLVPDLEPEVVVGPSMGGIAYALLLAARLPIGVQAAYAEKTEEGFTIRPSFARVMSGERRVLVVEDILTTGGSARAVVKAVEVAGGKVVGVVAICNRGGVTAEEVGSPLLASLAEVDFQAWDEAACPLCQKNVPITIEVGHGAAYVARRA